MSNAVIHGIAGLEALLAVELRHEWRQVFKTLPPQFTPDMLRRALAWRLQERMSGGLSAAVSRELRNRRADLEGGNKQVKRDHIKAGMRLIARCMPATRSRMASAIAIM
jgi:Protein of unknown function (DUF2924)